MKKYRIKKEAIPFILEKYATRVCILEMWESVGIDIKALEEVESAFITHGKKLNENSETLGGWSQEGMTIEFTIHFPSVKFHEHDKFSKGRITRDLMNKLQGQINYFYDQFLDGEISEEVKPEPDERFPDPESGLRP